MTAMPPLLGDEPWYSIDPIRPDLDLIVEPCVDEFLRANIWLIRGQDSAVVIDCGLGISPLSPVIHDRAPATTPVVLTHGHLDHAGAAHEFAERWGHPADEVHTTRSLSLSSHEHAADLGINPSEIQAESDWLVTRLPRADFHPREYLQLAAPLTRALADGDEIELGGTTLVVLHLPGHTPGSIALYDAARSELFSGDVVYDDTLLDSLPESDIAAYRASLIRLRDLEVALVRPGHGPCFDGTRLREILDAYLAATEPGAAPADDRSNNRRSGHTDHRTYRGDDRMTTLKP